MRRATLIAITTVLAGISFSTGAARAQSELFHQDSPSLHTASGMLLGVYANTTPQGLEIQQTIPGYSAEGRLLPGDVLLQATAEGMPTFSIRSHDEIEHAKSQIGPYREAAIEFFRPSTGLMYAWVTFKPVGGEGPPHVHDPQPAFTNPPVSNGEQQVFRPGPNFPPSNSNNVSPNNIAMRFQLQPGGGGNPNNLQVRSRNRGGPQSQNFNPNQNVNPNNEAPLSADLPTSPNNSPFHSGKHGAGENLNPNNGTANFFPDNSNLSSNNPSPRFAPESSNNSSPRSARTNQRFQAEFRLESEKPGARRLFNRGGRGGGDRFSPEQPSQNGFSNRSFNQGRLPQSGRQFGPQQQQIQQLKDEQRRRVFGR